MNQHSRDDVRLIGILVVENSIEIKLKLIGEHIT